MPRTEPMLIPGTEERRRRGVLLHMYIDEWDEFCETVDALGINRSEAVRRLVRAFNRSQAAKKGKS